MKIKTRQFGEIEFDENIIIKFENGLLGFEDLTEFLLIKTDNALFLWLNSVEKPELSFPLVCLNMIDENYPVIDEYEPFGVTILNSDPSLITVNLKAPIYINQENKTGIQKIIDDENLAVDYHLFIKQ
jgi:flagellar assembly factor FliW